VHAKVCHVTQRLPCRQVSSKEEIDEAVPGKAIPVTGPLVCEASWIPHILCNRLTDGSEFVGLKLRLDALYHQQN
jgi:hypothetical protein